MVIEFLFLLVLKACLFLVENCPEVLVIHYLRLMHVVALVRGCERWGVVGQVVRGQIPENVQQGSTPSTAEKIGLTAAHRRHFLECCLVKRQYPKTKWCPNTCLCSCVSSLEKCRLQMLVSWFTEKILLIPKTLFMVDQSCTCRDDRWKGAVVQNPGSEGKSPPQYFFFPITCIC